MYHWPPIGFKSLENLTITICGDIKNSRVAKSNINALKSNIDISSLVAIGKAASEGAISGSVGYEILGVESKEITAIIPINSEITSTINQVFLQAIGVVKGKIYDTDTRLYPQVIAVKHTGCDVKTITENLIGQYSTKD